MELAFTSWEYTPGTDLVAPLHSIERWIDQSIADASMSWLDCVMLDIRRPMLRSHRSLAAEAFSPGGRDRMAWLRRALTGGTKLLLLLGHRPDPFMHAFTKMDEMPAGVAQLRELPWCIPDDATPGLVASLHRAGGGTIIGHDAQCLFTAWPASEP